MKTLPVFLLIFSVSAFASAGQRLARLKYSGRYADSTNFPAAVENVQISESQFVSFDVTQENGREWFGFYTGMWHGKLGKGWVSFDRQKKAYTVKVLLPGGIFADTSDSDKICVVQGKALPLTVSCQPDWPADWRTGISSELTLTVEEAVIGTYVPDGTTP